LRCDGAAGAGPVLDDDRLPPALRKLVAERARDDVDAAAGRIRHQDVHRFRRKSLLRHRERTAEQQHEDCEQQSQRSVHEASRRYFSATRQ